MYLQSTLDHHDPKSRTAYVENTELSKLSENDDDYSEEEEEEEKQIRYTENEKVCIFWKFFIYNFISYL